MALNVKQKYPGTQGGAAQLYASDTCLSLRRREQVFTRLSKSYKENMDICFSFASLRSWLAFFSESDSAPRALPFSSSQGSVKKKLRGKGFERPVTRELTSAQCTCASPSLQKERGFAHPLHSTWSASLRCEQHDHLGSLWQSSSKPLRLRR